MNIGEWPTKRAMLQPDAPVIISDDGRTFTYDDFNRRVNRLANALPSVGVTRGKRIAALLPNCPEFLELLFATAKTGAVMVPLNYRLAARELSYILHDSGATALIYAPDFAEQVEALRGKVSDISKYVCVGEPPGGSDIEYESWTVGLPDGEPAVETEVTMDDPHFIMYTAGTTGMPKGAVLTHGNTHWNAINIVLSYMLTRNERNLVATPLYHIAGLSAGATPTIYSGGLVVLCRFFDPVQVLKMIERHKITHMFGVPSMFQVMSSLEDFEVADFSSVRFLITGGAPCPVPLIERYLSRGVAFSQGYGLTETAPGVTALPYEDALRKRGSAGKPLFYVTVEVVDDHEMEVPGGEVGEIVVKGPNVFKGYWNLPDETEEALRYGWFHTGDLGYFDWEGYLYITDRKKDMIISGGENIYPAEVENAIREHPAVADIIIIGVPDEQWGEAPLALVVAEPGASASEEELAEFGRERLARYKVPRKFLMVDEIPRNADGQVAKNELRARYAEE